MKTAGGQKLTETSVWHIDRSHSPSPPAPHPTLTLHQSYCKLNIKPIIPCIWVIVLARRVASTATSLAHTLQLMACLMLGGCWCRGGGRRPLKIYSAPPKTLVSEEQLKNTPTDFAVVVSSATLLMLCNAYINTFHSGCCKASVYGKRWYPGTKAEPPHWKKKVLKWKTLGSSNAADGSRGSCMTKGWSSEGEWRVEALQKSWEVWILLIGR